MSERKGLRFDGPCLVLVHDDSKRPYRERWQSARPIDWIPIVDRRHRAVEQLGTVPIGGRVHAVFLCDDDRVRAIGLKTLEAMKRHSDERVSA